MTPVASKPLTLLQFAKLLHSIEHKAFAGI